MTKPLEFNAVPLSVFLANKSVPRRFPVYMPASASANDNLYRAATKRGRIRKAVAILALALGIIYFAPKYVELVFERLERQAAARAAYDCEHYGPAMNKHYGREVCEEPAAYK